MGVKRFQQKAVASRVGGATPRFLGALARDGDDVQRGRCRFEAQQARQVGTIEIRQDHVQQDDLWLERLGDFQSNPTIQRNFGIVAHPVQDHRQAMGSVLMIIYNKDATTPLY
jgi:hypothetical protein